MGLQALCWAGTRHGPCKRMHVVGYILRMHIVGYIPRMHIVGYILRMHIDGYILLTHVVGHIPRMHVLPSWVIIPLPSEGGVRGGSLG